MSPTIPNNINGDKRPGAGRPGPGERRSELVCRVKYCNTLPDIPFDPKFITYPFDPTRFIQYNPTSLERNNKYEVLTEHDLGVTIDLINREQYSGDLCAILEKADENLLEEDILTPHDSRRSIHHSRSVSWLRRTEYISTEQTRFQPQVMDKVEAKVGYSIKKSLKEETWNMDRENQIKAIDKTFEDVKKPIERHYSKANVTPVEILPVFPDFKMWKYPCAQVMFDSDPAPVGRSVPAQLEEMSQAMIRGVMDESGEQFVAYFLPTESTLEKRRNDFTEGVEYIDDQEYEYQIAREYNWNVKTKASKGYEENYFLVVRQDGVFFNELETRVRLTKRRQKAGQQPNNTRLVVKHRPMDAQEFAIHRTREKQLEPPIEEEDEEDDDEEEGGGKSDKEESEKESDKESDKDSGKDSDKDSDKESDKEESDNKSDKEESDNKSDKEESDNKSDKEESDNKSDKEESDNKSDKEESDEKSDKEDSDNAGDKSDKEESDNAGGKSDKEDSDNAGDKSDKEKSDDSGGSEGGSSPKSLGSGGGSPKSVASGAKSDEDGDKSPRSPDSGKSSPSARASQNSESSSSQSNSDSD